MKPSPWTAVSLVCLAGLVGCRPAPVEPGPHTFPPRDPTLPAYLAEHRQAIQLFDDGRYPACVEALQAWLKQHDAAHPALGGSARYFTGLAYKHMGERNKARAAFRELCVHYADVPDTHPGVKWRRWAKQELRELGP